MQLVKKEFIDASKLSGREYLVSLLREAQKSGLVLPESAARIQKEGMDIVADLAMDFTDGLSSSIRIEQAQEFVLSVFYTAGLALKACPSPDETAFRLASKPLRTLYDEGTKIIIASTRQTGGSLRAISPYYRPASKGAGFHFVQALLSLPLLLAPPRGYFTL